MEKNKHKALHRETYKHTYFFSALMKKRVEDSERNKMTETQRTQTEGTEV